jgi:AraC-like DNA-binding protein
MDILHPSPPRIIVRGAQAAYIGPGLALAPHRNAVATIAIGLEGPFQLALADRGRDLGPSQSHAAAFIAPCAHHHLQSEGALAFVYLDPAIGVRIGAAAMSQQALRTYASDWIARALNDKETSCALEAAPLEPRDRRIAQALQVLAAEPDLYRSIGALAAHCGLSASRFQALLRLQTGVPFRRHRLWRRMALVLRALSAGATLTAAAQDAGFASSAHFSVAFRRMFGLAPSRLLAVGAVLDLR